MPIDVRSIIMHLLFTIAEIKVHITPPSAAVGVLLSQRLMTIYIIWIIVWHAAAARQLLVNCRN